MNHLLQRFELTERLSQIRVARQSKQAGLAETMSSMANAASEAGRQGLAAGAEALSAARPEQLFTAAEQGRDAALAVINKHLGGSLLPRPLSPTQKLQGQVQTFFSDPGRRNMAMLAGGGAVLTAVAAAYARQRRARQEAESRVSDLGILTKGAQFKLAEGSVRERAAALWDSIRDHGSNAAQSAMGHLSNAQAGLGPRVQHYVDLIQQGLKDPSRRPYVTAAIGAASGGALALGAEATSRRRQKRYLNSFLTGAGGGALAGGAYGKLVPAGGLDQLVAQRAEGPIKEEAQRLFEEYQASDPSRRQQIIQELESTERQLGPKWTDGITQAVDDNPQVTATAAGAAGGVAGGTLKDVSKWNSIRRDLGKQKQAIEGEMKAMRAGIASGNLPDAEWKNLQSQYARVKDQYQAAEVSFQKAQAAASANPYNDLLDWEADRKHTDFDRQASILAKRIEKLEQTNPKSRDIARYKTTHQDYTDQMAKLRDLQAMRGTVGKTGKEYRGMASSLGKAESGLNAYMAKAKGSLDSMADRIKDLDTDRNNAWSVVQSNNVLGGSKGARATRLMGRAAGGGVLGYGAFSAAEPIKRFINEQIMGNQVETPAGFLPPTKINTGNAAYAGRVGR